MSGPADLASASWLNEPASWSLDAGALRVVTDASTDFWRETHYGFVRDSGHFLGLAATPPFTAQLRLRGAFRQLYDQAGLMLRRDDRHWIKAGIEISDGAPQASAVVTAGRSDWSVAPLPAGTAELWLRLTVQGGAVRVQLSTDGAVWPLLRLAPFDTDGPLTVGPMCCTPERAGLEVTFDGFTVGPASERGLHDLG